MMVKVAEGLMTFSQNLGADYYSKENLTSTSIMFDATDDCKCKKMLTSAILNFGIVYLIPMFF